MVSHGKRVFFFVHFFGVFYTSVHAMEGELQGSSVALGVEHPLAVDFSHSDYDERMGNKACDGLQHLAKRSKWKANGLGLLDRPREIEAWGDRCKQQRVVLKERLRQGQQDSVEENAVLRATEALSSFDSNAAYAFFGAMQALGKKAHESEFYTGFSKYYREIYALGLDKEEAYSQPRDLGQKACDSLGLFDLGITQGLYPVSEGIRAELDLGMKACRAREVMSAALPTADKKKMVAAAQGQTLPLTLMHDQPDDQSLRERVALHNLNGRLAFFVSSLFERAKHCQYADQPGHVLATNQPVAPFLKSTTAVEFVRLQLNKHYRRSLGDDACESLEQLVTFIKDSKAKKTMNLALAVCKKRDDWVAEYNTYSNDDSDRDQQKRKPLEERLLAVDEMLARYSSESFLRWREKLPHMCTPQIYEGLKRVHDTGVADSLPYVPELGGAACKALGYVYHRRGNHNDAFEQFMDQCTIRSHLLASDPVKAAVAAKKPTVMSAFRRFDNNMAQFAYHEMRFGYLNRALDVAGFCVSSKSGMENAPDAERPSRSGYGAPTPQK